jgi:DNA-binding winged helix-turn-helix (wHTH) protein/tetratricopeptide (TPR) repeat protein
MAKTARGVYEFGPFHLEVETRRLWRGNEAVPLSAKLFEILLLLVTSGGHVVGKEELMLKVWPDTHVEENNLTVNISALRKLLRDGQNRYIETIQKRGYRFTPVVRALDQTADSGAPDAHELQEGMGLGSIAVLPFKLWSHELSDEYLGLGLVDTLITRLSSIRQLIVTPTRTVLHHVKSEHDPLAAGHRLNVDYVLDGQLQKDGERIRVTVQLTDVREKKLLWSEKFDESFTDIFAVEDSISERVARSLALKLTSEERRRLSRRPTENPAAFHAYLKGRYYWNKRTEEAYRKSLEYFESAIELDPDYALAYAGLADCYNLLLTAGAQSPGEAARRMKAAARKALELDATLAEVHASIGYVMTFHDWDWAGAEAEFRRAIELNPNYATAHHWYGIFLRAMGRFDEAIQETRRAQRLDPLSLIISVSLAGDFYYARLYNETVEQCRRTLELDPNFFIAVGLLGIAYAQSGRYAEAIPQLRRAWSIEPDNEVLTMIGYCHAMMGKRAQAKRVIAQLRRRAGRKYVEPLCMVIMHAALGEDDEAFAWLEKAYAGRNGWLAWIKTDPRLDPLRPDPRFADFERRLGFARDV